MTRPATIAMGWVALAVFLGAGPGQADESADKAASDASKKEVAKEEGAKEEAAKEPPRPSSPFPIYRPPSVGQPARTVGGGTRGPGDGYPSVYVLVPDHTGRTTRAQPTLYWYVDDAPTPDTAVRFTLLDEDSVEPVAETLLDTPTRAGFYAIPLAAQGVSLEPGMEYQWSVALAVDPDDHARDIVASGWIERVPRPAGLGSETGVRGVYVLAEQGMWYDALAELESEIRKRATDETLLDMRAALLDQVGLDAVARASLSQGGGS